jgi:PAS domain S-box-containing protein
MTVATTLRSVDDVESFMVEYYGAWGGTDEDRIMSYYADNVTVQIPGSLMQGKSAVREQFVRPFITAFPGNSHFVKNIILGRDVAVIEFTFKAEQTGPFAGYAATDARIELPGCGVYEYDSAKRQITSARIYFDVGTLLKQIIDQRDALSKTEEATAAQAGDIAIAAPTEHLDLATVIAVSQTVSGEIVPQKLLDILLRTAVKYAGAERALLILSRAAGHRIAAEATTANDAVNVRLCDEPITGSLLPETIIRYVQHSRESVILDDAAAPNPFSMDAYIARGKARSVFCLPLTNQAKFIGVLYLESNLGPRTLAPARTAVLKLLASQAAMALENTQLYRDLAERESKIRRLVDANILGICIWNLEGAIVEANEAFLKMLQCGREDIDSGRLRWPDLTPAEWREQDERAVAELRSTGTFRSVEKEYYRKDGSRVPVLIGGALFEGSGNEGVAFVLDLTERKRAEEALRESERSLRSAIDGIPGLVAILAPNGEVEAVNRQIIDYFGQSLEELKNWGTNGTVHCEDVPRVAEVFAKAIASGVPYQIEQRLRRFDGEYRWFGNHGIPIRDESGRIARWYVLLTDIEDRARALARLEEMQSDFARMNRVSMMGELAASLSHEITQPIASAGINASAAYNFMEMQPPDLDEVRQALAGVVGDTTRAAAIIDRIRAHVKKAPPRKERFDLNAAINEIMILARTAITKNGVSVQTRLADGLFPVHGDRVQVQQVVLNLTLNAVEAMGSVETGSRDLSISSEQDAKGVLVAVRDTGPGVDPAHLERVFQAFYTTKSSGVGMGLSICRSIIHAHGGRLWVEANKPRGAVFQFTLPDAEVRA